MTDPEMLRVLAALLKSAAYIAFYIIIGFGPGFIIGMMIANRYVGRNQPLRMNMHQENIQKAAAHNEQWHPDNPRWKK